MTAMEILIKQLCDGDNPRFRRVVILQQLDAWYQEHQEEIEK